MVYCEVFTEGSQTAKVFNSLDSQENTYMWSRTRKRTWAIAQIPILGTTITLKRLLKKGFQSLKEI